MSKGCSECRVREKACNESSASNSQSVFFFFFFFFFISHHSPLRIFLLPPPPIIGQPILHLRPDRFPHVLVVSEQLLLDVVALSLQEEVLGVIASALQAEETFSIFFLHHLEEHAEDEDPHDSKS